MLFGGNNNYDYVNFVEILPNYLSQNINNNRY
jgi:hypothetical protein